MTPTLALLLTLGMASANTPPVVIPTRFEADRVFALPRTRSGETIRFFTDSGGGGNLLCRSAADRLHLKPTPIPPDPELEGELGKNLGTISLPAFAPGAGVPANANGDAKLLVNDCAMGSAAMKASFGEGLLSSRWFDGRIWTWDYPGHTLTLQGSRWKPDPSAQRTPIGFRKASGNSPAFAMPRITITIDGQALDMLLDTGATGHPTPAGQDAQGGESVGGARATSFITTSVMNRWHAAHPDWTLIADGDDLFAPRMTARIIRVPEISIAGITVGPVWFTERADRNFREMMSSMTDRPVEGAIGGNALNHFAMTIDYPANAAYFRCTRDCKATPPPAP
jgi:hypothetical protein